MRSVVLISSPGMPPHTSTYSGGEAHGVSIYTHAHRVPPRVLPVGRRGSRRRWWAARTVIFFSHAAKAFDPHGSVMTGLAIEKLYELYAGSLPGSVAHTPAVVYISWAAVAYSRWHGLGSPSIDERTSAREAARTAASSTP